MPNWCMNKLTVCGPLVPLREFMMQAESVNGALSFDAFIPMPADVRNTAGAWYDWACDNWGTKWDCSEASRSRAIPSPLEIIAYVGEQQESEVIYSFDTAWSPPTPVFRHMVEAYPLLAFKMESAEPGMCFGAVMEGESGEITGSDDFDLSSSVGKSFFFDTFGFALEGDEENTE